MPALLEAQDRMDSRVLQCIAILIKDDWMPGETDQTLAKEWGCKSGVVYKVRSQALRIIRLSMGTDRDSMKAQILLRLDILYRASLNSFQLDNKGVKHDWVDVKGGAAALKLAAQITGILVHQHNHSGLEALREQMANKSDEELIEEVKRLQLVETTAEEKAG